MATIFSTDRNASLDVLRTLAFVGVVAIHASVASPTDGLAYWFNELSRFVVPVYFMLSGYFWKADELARPVSLVRRVAVRVLPAFLLWVAISVAVETLRDPSALMGRLTPRQLAVMFWTGGPGYHLWFLPALVVGTAIVAVAVKWFGWRNAAILSVALYAVGTLVGGYGRLLGGGIGDFIAEETNFVFRSGIFMAPIFLATGALLRRHPELAARVPLGAAATGVVLFGALHVAEGYFALGMRDSGHEYAFATWFYAVAMFVLFLKLDIRGRVWTLIGRASFTAYLVHLLVLQVFVLDLGLQLPLLVLVPLVSAVSLMLAVGFGTVRAIMSRPRDTRPAAA